MMRIPSRTTLSLFLVLAGDVLAEGASEVPADAPTQVLETVVVTGAQPGPGLWRVSKDDHVLWILGTLNPLPKRMDWIARDVEATIGESQQVILGPTVDISIDGGFLAGVFLLPSVMGARENPGDRMLSEVIPADLYARWQVLKRKYLPNNRSVEKWRPLFAAQELFEAALEKNGLAQKDVVTPVVKKAAKKRNVATSQPQLELKIAKPRDAVRDFKRAALDDVPCLRQTIERIETDLESIKARANAWSYGDIAALRELPYVDQRIACENAFLQANAVQDRGMDDLKPRVEKLWMDEAEAALAKNASTFAILSMGQLLRPTGLLEAMRAKGYAIEEP